jgi:hypothetical protein
MVFQYVHLVYKSRLFVTSSVGVLSLIPVAPYVVQAQVHREIQYTYRRDPLTGPKNLLYSLIFVYKPAPHLAVH